MARGSDQIPMTREQWLDLDLAGFGASRVEAYNNATRDFVKSASQSNRDGLVSYVSVHIADNNRDTNPSETFIFMQMMAKTSAALLSLLNRQSRHETVTG